MGEFVTSNDKKFSNDTTQTQAVLVSRALSTSMYIRLLGLVLSIKAFGTARDWYLDRPLQVVTHNDTLQGYNHE